MGTYIIIALAALAAGLVIGWLAASTRQSTELRELAESSARARQDSERLPGLEAKLEELTAETSRLKARVTELTTQHESDTEKADWIETAEKHLREAFEALASRALQNNSKEFTDRTQQQLVEPMQTKLKALDEQIRGLEQKREGAYGSLSEQLKHLKEAYSQLNSTTSSLTTALTASSGARGQWGEIQLRRIVDLAGMVPHVDFDEQETTEQGKPDMIVRLPGGGVLPVDAKTPMKTYLEVSEATDDSTRNTLLKAHAASVKLRIRELSRKEYWKQFDQSPDFVIMFLPNDAFMGAALEGDRDLLEYSLGSNVVPTTPATLLALLRTVAFTWQQHDMAENARVIANEARELSDRIRTFVGHLQKTGKNLNSAVDSYNSALGSYERRVLPSLRRFKELGVDATDAPEISQIDHQATLPHADDA